MAESQELLIGLDRDPGRRYWYFARLKGSSCLNSEIFLPIDREVHHHHHRQNLESGGCEFASMLGMRSSSEWMGNIGR